MSSLKGGSFPGSPDTTDVTPSVTALATPTIASMGDVIKSSKLVRTTSPVSMLVWLLGTLKPENEGGGSWRLALITRRQWQPSGSCRCMASGQLYSLYLQGYVRDQTRFVKQRATLQSRNSVTLASPSMTQPITKQQVEDFLPSIFVLSPPVSGEAWYCTHHMRTVAQWHTVMIAPHRQLLCCSLVLEPSRAIHRVMQSYNHPHMFFPAILQATVGRRHTASAWGAVAAGSCP